MSDHPLDAMVRKLGDHATLDPDDRAALKDMPFIRRTIEPADCLMREGDRSIDHAVLLKGHGCRQKNTVDGRRQIVSLHGPGDAFTYQALFLDKVDTDLRVFTRAEVAIIPRVILQELARARPAIARAILMVTLIEASTSSEWLLSIGQRDARTRMAHFLCELAIRLAPEGECRSDFAIPMTQEQLGETLGLTPVHVNRVLKKLEADGLIARHGRQVRTPDMAVLRRAAGFSPDYLYRDRAFA